MSAPFQKFENSPVLCVFGEHAARMASLLKCEPNLLQKLFFAPPRAIHAVAAFLYFSPQAAESDAIVAAILATTHPRVLLLKAFPDAPPRLYNSLDKAGDAVNEKEFYGRLFALSNSRMGDILLSSDEIDDNRLSWAEKLLGMDEVIASWKKLQTVSAWQLEAVNVMISTLRSYGVITSDDLKFPKNAGFSSLIRRLQTALDKVPAPNPPFSLTLPFRIIRNVGELRTMGTKLDNCVHNFTRFGSDHWFRLTIGLTVYVASDDPLMLCTIRRVGPNLWHIEQIAGPKNKPAGEEITKQLDDALSVAGLELVRMTPSNAMCAIADILRKEEDGFEDGLAA